MGYGGMSTGTAETAKPDRGSSPSIPPLPTVWDRPRGGPLPHAPRATGREADPLGVVGGSWTPQGMGRGAVVRGKAWCAGRRETPSLLQRAPSTEADNCFGVGRGCSVEGSEVGWGPPETQNTVLLIELQYL